MIFLNTFKSPTFAKLYKKDTIWAWSGANVCKSLNLKKIKYCKMKKWLQNSASIRLRTDLTTFGLSAYPRYPPHPMGHDTAMGPVPGLPRSRTHSNSFLRSRLPVFEYGKLSKTTNTSCSTSHGLHSSWFLCENLFANRFANFGCTKLSFKDSFSFTQNMWKWNHLWED